MALERTTSEPKVEDFTPLSEHQEQTPDTFYSAKPVLHLHSPSVSLSYTIKDFLAQPALLGLTKEQDGKELEDRPEALCTLTGLDVWVTSKQLTFFAPENNYGVHVPYQSIVVHAAEGDEVLLGPNLSERDTPDEDMTFVQLRITPKTSKKHPASGITDSEERERIDGQPYLSLFNAISACQELNPDPPEDGEEEEGFDETAPGATGWITSENMADFMDENGDFKMPEGVTVVGGEDKEGVNGVNRLGEGAGRTRSAAEADGEAGAEDETKWQRTG